MTATKSILVIAAILFIGCATPKAPTGGPKDLTSPRVDSTYPPNRTINFRQGDVTVIFSKDMNIGGSDRTIAISPPTKKHVTSSWSTHNELLLTLPDSLADTTTYTITLGTNFSDDHEGTKLERPFNFSFSTGPRIDTGKISGKIIGNKKNVTVAAFQINTRSSSDTFSVINRLPDAVTESAADGTWELVAMHDGRYLVIVCNDDNHNQRYEPDIEGVGIAPEIITITNAKASPPSVNLTLQTMQEVTAPGLFSAEFRSPGELRLKWSKQIDTAGLLSQVTLYDSTAKNNISLKSLMNSGEPLVTAFSMRGIERSHSYSVSTRLVRDIFSFALGDTTIATSFASTFSAADTVPPSLTSLPFRDSSILAEKISSIRYIFSEEITLDPDIKVVTLRNEALKKELNISLSQALANEILITPGEALPSNAWHTLYLVLRGIQDASGNRLLTKDSTGKIRDSTLLLHFRSFDERMAGTVSGNVFSRDSSQPILVLARNTKTESVYKQRTRPDGTFTMELPEGSYLFSAVIDRNNDGRWTPGSAVPPRFAEPLTELLTPVNVRARWKTEGVKLEF